MDEKPAGHLAAHILAFGYLLREMDVPLGPGQMFAVLEALEHVPVTSREDFRAAPRRMLVLRHEDLALFDTAFEFYWRTAPGANPESHLLNMAIPQVKVPRRQLRRRRREDAPEPPAGQEREREDLELRLTFSRDEILRHKDFAQCSGEEVQAAKELIRRMRWRVEARPTRRRRPARLISDGWDRGAPTVLRREMDRLQWSCHRLIWLNPLLGSPEYEPLTVGMQAALPFVDNFLPVHNLVSLEQLGAKLSTISAKPTARRQRPVLVARPE